MLAKFRILILFAGLVAYFTPVVAQPSTVKADWAGEWITTPDADTAKNGWLCFRKTFSLERMPSDKTVASIAVDSKYWLYINNKLVVFEGQLKRGPTPEDTYYEDVDISKYLKKGDNTIALLVWFWGRDGFCHKNSGRAGLLFEAKNLSKILVKSDPSWKTRSHPAYGFTGLPVPNYRLPEFNIHFDARKDTPDWFHERFDDSAWLTSMSAGNAGTQPWNRLWKRPFPQWDDSGIVPYINKVDHAVADTLRVVKMKLPKNLSITPYLKINAPAGLLIDIRTDNYKGGSEYNVRAEYVTKEGVQEFESLGYMNGHEVWYSIPAGVKILELKYRETKYPTKHVGYFRSDDADLNTLWIKSLNTMNVNMRDAIQDPDRERSQWWGDAVILLGQIFYSSDSIALAAIRKSMSNLIEWQKKDGVLFSPIPAGNWNRELPSQMLASIGRYGFYKYFEYTNDSTFIKYVYPAAKKYMTLWELDKRDLVVHRKGGWDWFDWGTKMDVPIMDNAWYYMALDGVSKMAEVSGYPEDAKMYQSKMARLRLAFNREYWKENAYRSADYKFGADDRGNGLAVVAGLVSKAQWEKMKPMMDTAFYAGPYLEKYVLESYFIMGDADLGLKRMKKRYSDMIDSDVSTLWEGWVIGGKGYGGGSYNHGWSGGPMTLMSQYVAGLSPGRAGYSSIDIFPQPGHLTSIEMGAETRAGFVKINIANQKDFFKLRIRANSGTTMRVGIPISEGYRYSKIAVNQHTIFENNLPIHHHKVKYIGKSSGYLIFELPSGSWTFTGRKQKL